MRPSDDVSRSLPPLHALASSPLLDRFIAAARQAVAAHLSTSPDSHNDVYRASHRPWVDVWPVIMSTDVWLLNVLGIIQNAAGRHGVLLCVVSTYPSLVGDEPLVQVRPGISLWVAQDTGYSAESVIAALEQIAYLVQS